MPDTPDAATAFPRDLRFYLLATGLTATAFFAQGVAVGWSVYEKTGSPVALGFVGLAQFLPVLLFFLPAGHVADRFERRAVVALSLGLSAAAAAVLTAVSLFDLSVMWIYAALVASGCAQILYRPARDALLPALVSRDRLSRAIAINTSVFQTASMATPAVAGFGIALFHSVVPIHAIDAALTLVALFLTLAIRTRSRGLPAAGAPDESRFKALFAGFSHVWRTRLLLAVMSIDMFAVLFGGAVALLPLYAKDILQVGPSGLGILTAAPAVGAVVVGLAIAKVGITMTDRLFLWSVAGFGLATVVFGASTSFGLSLAALAAIGGLDSISMVIRQTVVQRETPDALRGRVAAVNRVFISSSNELGALESGLLSALTGPVAAVVFGGVMTILIVAASPRVFPQLRRLQQAAHG
ncbi:MAG: MFS transporter [Zoogloea sp.]|nr:MFS transporter [Zoogloea sp.]